MSEFQQDSHFRNVIKTANETRVIIPKSIMRNIRKIAKDNEENVFVILLATMAVVLSRSTKRECIEVSLSPGTSNQNIGFPLAITVTDDLAFGREFLVQLKKRLKDAGSPILSLQSDVLNEKGSGASSIKPDYLIIERELDNESSELSSNLVFQLNNALVSPTIRVSLQGSQFAEAIPEGIECEVLEVLRQFANNPHIKIREFKLCKASDRTSNDNNQTECDGLRNATERDLLSIWQAILGVKKISRFDSFFKLGGRSLDVVKLVARIQSHFNKKVTVRELFARDTISEQANLIVQGQTISQASILQAKPQESYSLTSAQLRLFLLDKMYPQSTHYQIPIALKLTGRLDRERFTSAFREIALRHPALRSSFATVDGVPRQFIHDDPQLEISYDDDSSLTLDQHVAAILVPFSLKHRPLFRIKLIDGDAQYVLINFHHIIVDGMSIDIILQEFLKIYGGESLKRNKIGYHDFAVWQQNQLQTSTIKAHQRWWVDHFKEGVPVLDLPLDKPRPVKQDFKGASFDFSIDMELTRSLRDLAQNRGVTLNILLFAGFSILLAKHAMQEDLVIGTPVSGRNHVELENMVGMFVNTLAIRCVVRGDSSFEDFLDQTKSNFTGAIKNQDYPFEDLVKYLKVPQDAGRNPIFDVMFAMQSESDRSLYTPDLKLELTDISYNYSKFDLTLFAHETKDTVDFAFEYSVGLFHRQTVEQMSHRFRYLLHQIVAHPTRKLQDFNLVNNDELAKNLEIINKTTVSQTAPSFLKLLEEQVRVRPEKAAVVCEAISLTYQQIWEDSGAIAAHLLSQGVTESSIIGIRIGDSVEKITTIIAIWRIGCGFLALEPEAPVNRTIRLLHNCNCSLVVSEKTLTEDLPDEVAVIDVMDARQCRSRFQLLDPAQESEGTAYVVYTSGSSGSPKGIEVSRKNILNYSLWFLKFARLGPADHSALVSSYSFDLGFTNIFPLLLAGGTVHLIPKETYRNPDLLLNSLGAKGVTLVKLTPTLFSLLNRGSSSNWQRLADSLRMVVLGGEVLKASVIRDFHQKFPEIELINHYGPSETTVGSLANHLSHDEIMGEDVLAIGQPIDNTKIYILDQFKNHVPRGAVGELYIAGSGVSKGYLGLPSETKKAFLANPFASGTLYRTGDLVKLNSTGQIVCLGRRDSQYKIRGYRVEIAEIEDAILQHPQILEVAVIHRSPDQLRAYIIVNRELSLSDVRGFLRNLLPEYMIPSQFAVLSKMPVNLNGKIDRRLLPEQVELLSSLGDATVAKSQTEATLLRLWSDILETKVVSLHESFFDLGGNSLLILKLHAEIEKCFSANISVAELFTFPTVFQLSEFIDGNSEVNGKPDLQLPMLESKCFLNHPPIVPSVRTNRFKFDFPRNHDSCNNESGLYSTERLAMLFALILAEYSTSASFVLPAILSAEKVRLLKINLENAATIAQAITTLERGIRDSIVFDESKYFNRAKGNSEVAVGFGAISTKSLFSQRDFEWDIVVYTDVVGNHLHIQCDFYDTIDPQFVSEMIENFAMFTEQYFSNAQENSIA